MDEFHGGYQREKEKPASTKRRNAKDLTEGDVKFNIKSYEKVQRFRHTEKS